jgi:hypothetical protein
MRNGPDEQLRPGIALREIVQQTTEALIFLKAERLEELARSCAALNREMEDAEKKTKTAMELQEAREDLKLLGRVLTKTRSNLTVLSRLHALRLGEAIALQGKRSAGQSGYSGVVLDVFNRREKAAEYGDN